MQEYLRIDLKSKLKQDCQLIKKAFQWKASGKFTNQEIIEKLAARGLKITLRNMSWILSNPFYCGFISSTMLPEGLVKVYHPAIIYKEIFLAANM